MSDEYRFKVKVPRAALMPVTYAEIDVANSDWHSVEVQVCRAVGATHLGERSPYDGVMPANNVLRVRGSTKGLKLYAKQRIEVKAVYDDRKGYGNIRVYTSSAQLSSLGARGMFFFVIKGMNGSPIYALPARAVRMYRHD